jgi:AcrR family transcriptional regulator
MPADAATTHPPATGARRMTAAQRRETVIHAAVIEFAEAGFFGTSTEAIAARAGISQPYIFRLFGSKQKLFLLTAQRCFHRILETFQAAAATSQGDPFEAMGEAYMKLLSDRRLLMVWMHAFAACSDPEIQAAMAAGFREMYEFLEGLPSATPEKVSQFMYCGMFLNVAAVTDMRLAMTEEEWSRRGLA